MSDIHDVYVSVYGCVSKFLSFSLPHLNSEGPRDQTMGMTTGGGGVSKGVTAVTGCDAR